MKIGLPLQKNIRQPFAFCLFARRFDALFVFVHIRVSFAEYVHIYFLISLLTNGIAIEEGDGGPALLFATVRELRGAIEGT